MDLMDELLTGLAGLVGAGLIFMISFTMMRQRSSRIRQMRENRAVAGSEDGVFAHILQENVSLRRINQDLVSENEALKTRLQHARKREDCAILGLDPSRFLTADALRRAYRLRAKAAHPDAGGDMAAFMRLRHAHERLSETISDQSNGPERV